MSYGFDGNMTALEWLRWGMPPSTLTKKDQENFLQEGLLVKNPAGKLELAPRGKAEVEKHKQPQVAQNDVVIFPYRGNIIPFPRKKST